MAKIWNHNHGRLLISVAIFLVCSCTSSVRQLKIWDNPDSPMSVDASTRISFSDVGKIVIEDSIVDWKGNKVLPKISYSLDSLTQLSIPILEKTIRTNLYGFERGDFDTDCIDSSDLLPILQSEQPPTLRLNPECHKKLKASKTRYLISIPLVTLKNKEFIEGTCDYFLTIPLYFASTCTHTRAYNAPILYAQVAVYDIEKQAISKSIVYVDSLSENQNNWGKQLNDFAVNLTNPLPIKNSLKPLLENRNDQRKQSLEIFLSPYYIEYLSGDLYELFHTDENQIYMNGIGISLIFRYVREVWGLGYKIGTGMSQISNYRNNGDFAQGLFDIQHIHTLSGHLFVYRTQSYRIGLLAGLNYGSMKSLGVYFSEFLSDTGNNQNGQGFGHTFGVSFDYLFRNFRASLNTEYETVTSDFGRHHLNASGLSFNFAVGWNINFYNQ